MTATLTKDNLKHGEMSTTWMMRSHDEMYPTNSTINDEELHAQYSSQISFESAICSDIGAPTTQFGSATPYNSPLSVPSDHQVVHLTKQPTMTPQRYHCSFHHVELNQHTTRYYGDCYKHYAPQRLHSNASGSQSGHQTPTKEFHFKRSGHPRKHHHRRSSKHNSFRKSTSLEITKAPQKLNASNVCLQSQMIGVKSQTNNQSSNATCVKFFCCCDTICFEALCPSLVRQSKCAVILAGGAVVSAIILGFGFIYFMS